MTITRAALLLPQLYAMRALLEGLVLALELEATGGEAPKGDECPHPEGRQTNATTMGGPPQILCLECGEQRLGVLDR